MEWIHFVVTPSSQNVFEVGSYYRVLHSTSHQSFPWKSLRQPKFPTKVSLFPLGNSFGEILTTNNLCQLTLVVIDWRCMCKRDRETIDHLFLHCTVAIELWTMVFSCVGCIGSCQKVLWSS